MKSKCVHTVAIGDWRPDICAITIPNLKRYAERIGADFNLISKAKFPDYPPNYERLQVWEAGRKYAWNICLDADMLLHKDCEDPTEWMNPREFGILGMLDASKCFRNNIYFERDGRNIGVADAFVVSSNITHDIWTPLEMPFDEARKHVDKEWMVSEFCLSVNAARFGLKVNGALKDQSKVFHAPAGKLIESFSRTLLEWGE